MPPPLGARAPRRWLRLRSGEPGHPTRASELRKGRARSAATLESWSHSPSPQRPERLAARSERPELIADEVHRRDEHDGDCLGDDLAEAKLDEHIEDEQV